MPPQASKQSAESSNTCPQGIPCIVSLYERGQDSQALEPYLMFNALPLPTQLCRHLWHSRPTW
jgi:hypothetical protein